MTDDSPPPQALRRAAQQRLGQLLDSGAVTLDALRARSTPLPALLAIAGHAADESLATQLIASLGDEEQLGELALHGPSPAVRQKAAEQMREPALIARLLKDARGGKDNNVYRILKTKRDAQHAQERAAAEALAAMTTLCASIERHVLQPFSSAYVTAVDHLAGQWQAVAADAPAELQARAAAALERCRDVVGRHLQQLAREAAEAAALEQAIASRQALLADLPQWLAQAFDASLPDTDARLATLATRWGELAAFKAPGRDETARYEQLRGAIDAVASFNAQHGSVQQQAASLDDSGAAAGAVRALKPVLQHLPLLDEPAPDGRARSGRRGAGLGAGARRRGRGRGRGVRQVGGLLRKAQSALAAGHSRQAGGHAARTRGQAGRAAGAAVSRSSPAQLQAFDEKLSALQDWRSFAVAPKRVELIEQMEALVGSTGSPTKLAEQIKRLQDEWKLISKGGTEDTKPNGSASTRRRRKPTSPAASTSPPRRNCAPTISRSAPRCWRGCRISWPRNRTGSRRTGARWRAPCASRGRCGAPCSRWNGPRTSRCRKRSMR